MKELFEVKFSYSLNLLWTERMVNAWDRRTDFKVKTLLSL